MVVGGWNGSYHGQMISGNKHEEQAWTSAPANSIWKVAPPSHFLKGYDLQGPIQNQLVTI
jgi:hypothetical protein